MREAISTPEGEAIARQLRDGMTFEDACFGRGLDAAALERGGWKDWCLRAAGALPTPTVIVDEPVEPSGDEPGAQPMEEKQPRRRRR